MQPWTITSVQIEWIKIITNSRSCTHAMHEAAEILPETSLPQTERTPDPWTNGTTITESKASMPTICLMLCQKHRRIQSVLSAGEKVSGRNHPTGAWTVRKPWGLHHVSQSVTLKYTVSWCRKADTELIKGVSLYGTWGLISYLYQTATAKWN
jgi:hypothetical protein